MRTVREAVFAVMRQHEMTTIFANPGSTEVPMLADLPADLDFVLGLHEGSVVGMATGWALGKGRPALVLLHTTAGLGNAVGAISTARENRAPLVILVGQQDRRHLASVPFLAGRLEGLAGDHTVWTGTPARAADLPSIVARAHHEAVAGRGPALVIVPMDDWEQPVDEAPRLAAPREFHIAAGADEGECHSIAERLHRAHTPVIVAGAGADEERCWNALVSLADHLDCPVWQEPFGARAGFPQDSERFAGHLPSGRAGLRAALTGHDLVLVVGTAALRQYGYEPGPIFAEDAEVVVVTDDPAEAAHSTADLALVAALPPTLELLASYVDRRPRKPGGPRTAPGLDLEPETTTDPELALRAQQVFTALARRLPAETILLEETPSTRSQLQDLVPARRPLGFLSAAMGGLGFAMPAAIGLRMACNDRPVVAVVGDGSSLYNIQALWSAQQYRTGVLFVVLCNGGYNIMDRLAKKAGGSPPWPGLDDIEIDGLARSLGCPSLRVSSHPELLSQLDQLVPTLADRKEPFLLSVVVSA
jgi:thiamine pyrophosphate-dependent acetolactate synthase large subunit-like protein